MFDAGLYVTLNSDDPPMFGTSINEEWSRCVATFGFSREEVKQLSMNSVEAALVSDDRRAELRQRVESVFGALAY